MDNKPFLGRSISILYRQMQIYLNRHLKDLNISSSEYFFLLHLSKGTGLCQDELSQRAFVDKAFTARSIQSLKSKGYVNQAKDPNDKRRNLVSLTSEGQEIIPKIIQVLDTWNASLIHEIGLSEALNLAENLELLTTQMSSNNQEELK
ncbi:MAG: MarR family transcriptional regulator [Vallitaleaceae bacterium]|nr:MarR family transcriptional regulator [Vallitaleaceae bacterium]